MLVFSKFEGAGRVDIGGCVRVSRSSVGGELGELGDLAVKSFCNLVCFLLRRKT